MAKLTWDEPVNRLYEAGVSKGVIYPMNRDGSYGPGSAWNGLISVTVNPSGSMETEWADNLEYRDRLTRPQFSATINAYDYPAAFGTCIGEECLSPGIYVMGRRPLRFGLCYRTGIGNAISSDIGYKIHFIYGAYAEPSETAYETYSEELNPLTHNWTIHSKPLRVSGLKPISHLVVDSRSLSEAKLASLSELIYGTDETDPVFPMPDNLVHLHGYLYEALFTRDGEAILTRDDQEIIARVMIEE